MMRSEIILRIKPFMTIKLKLSANELLLYALIYAYSFDGKGEFFASKKYITEVLGIAASSVYRILGDFVHQKYIFEIGEDEPGKPKRYRVNTELARALDEQYSSERPSNDAAPQKLDRSPRKPVEKKAENGYPQFQKRDQYSTQGYRNTPYRNFADDPIKRAEYEARINEAIKFKLEEPYMNRN